MKIKKLLVNAQETLADKKIKLASEILAEMQDELDRSERIHNRLETDFEKALEMNLADFLAVYE